MLTRAVSDRLRTSHVTVAMTGGLDSSSIAATAVGSAQRARPAVDAVDAHTIVYDHLIPDRERHFAGLVAERIGMPITFTAVDDRPIYERADAIRRCSRRSRWTIHFARCSRISIGASPTAGACC